MRMRRMAKLVRVIGQGVTMQVTNADDLSAALDRLAEDMETVALRLDGRYRALFDAMRPEVVVPEDKKAGPAGRYTPLPTNDDPPVASKPDTAEPPETAADHAYTMFGRAKAAYLRAQADDADPDLPEHNETSQKFGSVAHEALWTIIRTPGRYPWMVKDKLSILVQLIDSNWADSRELALAVSAMNDVESYMESNLQR